MSDLGQTRRSTLLDAAWRTAYRVGFPLARIWWRLRHQQHEGALVAVYAGQALLLVRWSAIQSDRATLLQCSRSLKAESFRPTRADGDRWYECQWHGLGATAIPYHIICMSGCVVRHSKDWPPMSESGQTQKSECATG